MELGGWKQCGNHFFILILSVQICTKGNKVEEKQGIKRPIGFLTQLRLAMNEGKKLVKEICFA